ncbi:MAG TPA: hypothetical protein VNA20_15590 [Frankiaceae bacterium]|nr:hypothetical protein [Frankiaceae bacterium]
MTASGGRVAPRRALVPLLAFVAVVSAPAGPAGAAGSTYEGGCDHHAAPIDGGLDAEGGYAGVATLAIVLRSADGGLGAADVRCVLWVDGDGPRDVITHHVEGAAVTAAVLRYEVSDRGVYVGVCTVVDWADGTPDVYSCPPKKTFPA